MNAFACPRFNVAVSRARDQLWLFHSVTLNDLKVTEENEEQTENISEIKSTEDKKDKWLSDLFENSSRYFDKINYLVKKWFTREEAKEKLDSAIAISEGASNWGYVNKKFGGFGAKAISLSFIGSIGKCVVNLFEYDNPTLRLILNLWDGVL